MAFWFVVNLKKFALGGQKKEIEQRKLPSFSWSFFSIST
jgi:hypothetical protein